MLLYINNTMNLEELNKLLQLTGGVHINCGYYLESYNIIKNHKYI